MSEPSETCRLYLISPAKIDPERFKDALKEALAAGDVAAFQLRLKDCPEAEIERAAKALIPICNAFEVAFILNDNAALAKKVGADGVHLGQSDGPVKEARDLLGFDATIGVTCHDSKHLAFLAGEDGADYVAFGAFYPTKTKDSGYRPKPELLSDWAEIAEIPSVAIGGITPENADALIKAGANFVAVSSAVWDHPEGPRAAVKAFNEILK